jgi:hypothetical protein
MAAPRPGQQNLQPLNYRDAHAGGEPVPQGLGPVPFHPSQPQGGNPNRRVLLPGCDFPPADAIPVLKVLDADINPGDSDTLVTIDVPDTMSFRASHVGFGAEDETALAFLTWSIRYTPPGSNYYCYSNVPAALGSIRNPAAIFAVFGSSVRVELVATNNGIFGASAYHYFGLLQGWFYSEREATK